MKQPTNTMNPVFKILLAGCIVPFGLRAQTNDSTKLTNATLQNVVAYAIKHQPLVEQAKIDEQITDNTIKSKLADWYPQVNFNYNLQHNFQVQTSIIGGNPVQLGVNNTSALQFTATQQVFNRDVLLALRSKDDVRLQSRQNTSNNKIAVAVNVSKAFYDIIATSQQIKVADENIRRTQTGLNNSFNQYKAGLVDKTDYKRATIALNNLKASKQSNELLLKAKLQYLKNLMGYPDSSDLSLAYDSLQMEKEINYDTLKTSNYQNRIEYKLLETQRKLQEANLKYNKWAFLPSVSANAAYNMNFLNNDFGKLYNTNYPNSYAGLTLGFPIFQGGKRKYNISTAEWQLKRTDWDIVKLKNAVSAEYSTALANYRSSLNSYLAIKENVDLAKEVYDVIQLQYKNGVKTYLEVITAESDLRTSQINYYNALYQVIASKIDIQKALGEIVY
jgi:outer membrane protein